MLMLVRVANLNKHFTLNDLKCFYSFIINDYNY